MKLKRVLATVLSAAMVLSCLVGCGSSTADTSAGSTSSSASTDSASQILPLQIPVRSRKSPGCSGMI